MSRECYQTSLVAENHTQIRKDLVNTTFANIETSKLYMQQVGDIAKQLSRMGVDAAKTFGTTLRLKGGGVSNSGLYEEGIGILNPILRNARKWM
jgi:hypothetical protein